MKKTIKLDVEFPDGFVPPEKFDDPALDPEYNSKCDLCPFFVWDEDTGFGCCLALGDDAQSDPCPIKEQF